ncbi:hypothetical protein Slin15195_G018830 [Septoria linicola]|uniref:Uncharacterized protein n=1 Tax=Septoria linicola TaxID=215465 RepID=A0A9Q9AIQ8_9PEZI|nr:hypothetical protein Slin15195_G018830 [Septoria linicola]
MANQSSSPLMSLPAELRNHIYELALSDTVVKIENFREGYNSINRSPGLILTCHQICREALGLYYSVARFTMQYGEQSCLSSWLDSIGQERSDLIKSIDVNHESWNRSFFIFSSVAEPQKLLQTAVSNVEKKRREVLADLNGRLRPETIKIAIGLPGGTGHNGHCWATRAVDGRWRRITLPPARVVWTSELRHTHREWRLVYNKALRDALATQEGYPDDDI